MANRLPVSEIHCEAPPHRLRAEVERQGEELTQILDACSDLVRKNGEYLAETVSLWDENIELLTTVCDLQATIAAPTADSTNSGILPSKNPLSGRKPRGKDRSDRDDAEPKRGRGGIAEPHEQSAGPQAPPPAMDSRRATARGGSGQSPAGSFRTETFRSFRSRT
jgi:hypothetical protein